MKSVMWGIAAIILIAFFIRLSSSTNGTTSANDKTVNALSSSATDTALASLSLNVKTDAATEGENKKLVAELSKYARFKKDEFKGTTWVHPKSEPEYRNQNGMYCYFASIEHEASNFRFVIQYKSDDWLFIRKYAFLVDGKPYSLVPSNMERDNGDGDIWEWCDESIGSVDIELIRALANAKSAKIRYEGDQYYKEKIIPAGQLQGIKRMLNLYTAMGGTFGSL